ncbi:MAG TPA: efflux transporter periplasmic adaptor subunit, partial [Deinococcales bacterium]|nr:efflux transporter periplasmic adaptor subunit [Deinococcales bacterium]
QGRMVNLTAELEEDSAGIPGGSVASLPYEIVLAEGALLPAGAVRGGDEVLVEQDGRAESLAVTVLAETGGQVAVSGLPEDARVIYPLPADLRPGTAVRIVD